MTKAADPLTRAVARVEPLTLALGGIAAGYELATQGWRSAAAMAVGAVISWLNYRWLRAGVSGLTAVPAPQADAQRAEIELNQPAGTVPTPRPAFGALAKFFGRVALLLIVLYVILSRSLLPASPLLAGLFAAVAAVILQMIFLLASGGVMKTN